MKLDKKKFIQILLNLKSYSESKKREWLTMYKGKTCAYWNGIIWKEIINDKNIKGQAIDKYEFFNYIKGICNNQITCNILFDRINNKSKCINLYEFESFLELIEENDYCDIINCLKEDKNNYYNTILNGIVSPDDNRDIIIDNMIFQDDYYKLPKILDYRKDLLPVRDQKNQGSCFAMAAACMKEWQEKQDYELNEYLSPQFLYNQRDNLYDDIKNNDEGMYARNVMKLLNKIGICYEKNYRYGIIENKKYIDINLYKQAKEHIIKGYAQVLSKDALKYSLKINGPCLVVFPVYNFFDQFWKKNEGDTFLGGHAMVIVGYTENYFIIRNSWGNGWCDNGYCYYFYEDWGCHWEIWTTLDNLGSKLLKPIIESKSEFELDEKSQSEPKQEVEPHPEAPPLPKPKPEPKKENLSYFEKIIRDIKNFLFG